MSPLFAYLVSYHRCELFSFSFACLVSYFHRLQDRRRSWRTTCSSFRSSFFIPMPLLRLFFKIANFVAVRSITSSLTLWRFVRMSMIYEKINEKNRYRMSLGVRRLRSSIASFVVTAFFCDLARVLSPFPSSSFITYKKGMIYSHHHPF